MKKSILLIGPIPPPNGGMAMQGKLLYSHLVSSGAEVEYLATNYKVWPEFVNQIKVIRAFYRFIGYIIKLWRATGKHKVIHMLSNSGWSWYLYSVPAITIAKLRNCRIIINYRGGGAKDFFQNHKRFALMTLKKADSIVVPSPFLKEVFNRFDVKSHIIPNIVTLPDAQKEAQKHHNEALTFIVTRNLERIYDIKTAIVSFAKVQARFPKIKLKIAGSGPELNSLKALTKELKVEHMVEFCGRLNRDEMNTLYQSADVLLNTSTVDNMPNALLEAQAYGVPIISSNVGGIPYIVKNGESAILINPQSPDELAQQMIRLIENPHLRAHLAKQGRENIKAYTWDHVGPQWMTVYQGR